MKRKMRSWCFSLVICEGEKDVVTAYCNGASALTFTSGAGALPAKITLADRYNKVYIVYDNDEKGELGAQKLAKRLYSLTKVQLLKLYVMKWEEKPSRYDLTDWFSDGHSLDQLLACCVRFGDKPEDIGGMRSFSPSQFAKTFVKMPEPIIDDLFFEKDIMGLAGGTNVGKSVMSLQLSTCLALGVPFLGFRIPKPRKVMHVQFELKDESFKQLIERTAMHFVDKYPVEAERFEQNLSILSSGQDNVFTDKWEEMDANLTFDPCEVLVVDNLYTSTNKNVSKNDDVMDLLRTMVNLKNKHKVAILIVSHHKKIGEASPLDVSMMLGGSAYTNHLDGIVQLASSQRLPGLNEMFWYTDPKESVEEKVLQAIATEGHNFSREMFKAALDSVVGVGSNTAVSNWLDRMINQGLISKIGHGQYRKMETELDSFND